MKKIPKNRKRAIVLFCFPLCASPPELIFQILIKMSANQVSPQDTFQILLATDCHLGYMERDAVRGADSLITFEEILQIAVKKKVDFILLGGDLFHENKPSRKTIHHCMELLRKYCMGDEPVQFQFLSDQSDNFKHSSFPMVNYEDPNLNIALPVFSIHGNHDDPAGSGSLCSLDLLSVTGLVNYFGKCVDLDNVQISPLLLQKGSTKLALFGLGSIRDERLHRLFREGKVTMLRPRENYEEWFNLFTLHQNRSKHGQTNYIPEQFLDDFLDLVIWGHEHECRLAEEWNSQQNFYVTQPGSSVATSLCHGEAVKKHVGLLQINKKTFKITEIPLQTVRQFFIQDIDLDSISLDLHSPDAKEKVIEYCKEVVEGFLQKAIAEKSGHPKQPEKPLIRLRVFYSENLETFSVQRFGQSYVDRVANPKDIILFSRKKIQKLKSNVMDADALQTVLKQDGIDKSRVEDLVRQYFVNAEETKKLSLLSETGVSNAVKEYVDKEVTEAITVLITHQLTKVQGHLKTQQVDDSLIDGEIQNYKKERMKNSSQELAELQSALKDRSTAKTSVSDVNNQSIFDDDTIEIVAPKGRGRGRGRGRGSRGGRAASTSNGRSTLEISNSSRSSSRATTSNMNDSIQSRKERFESTWKSSSKQRSIQNFFGNDSDIECVDESDEEKPAPKRKKAEKSKRKGVMYASDSDESF